MKDTATKLAFIEARAAGKSYSTIQKELGIAKATCAAWEKALKSDISALKQAQTEELYKAYNMSREARIKSLGSILDKLDKAIAEKTLDEMPLDKLLELKLKYSRALKEEYIEPIEPAEIDTLDGLSEEYTLLLEDAKAGRASPANIKARLSILSQKTELVKDIAYERVLEDGRAIRLANEPYISYVRGHDERYKEEKQAAALS